MKADRGILTKEIKEKAEKYLGREFTQKELRLYPYMQYCFMNYEGHIERAKLRDGESEILRQLVNEHHLIRVYPAEFSPAREFWAFMNDILADTYVILAEDLKGAMRNER